MHVFRGKRGGKKEGNGGVEMQLIAEILGHKDLRSTRIYSHFSESSIKQSMSVFEKSLVSAKCQQALE